MTYKAIIEPYTGKYYGTIVSVYKDNKQITSVKFWTRNGDSGPSERELEVSPDGEVDWGHYESAESLRLATIFKEALENER